MATAPDYLTDSLNLITGAMAVNAPDLDTSLGSVLQQWSTGIASSHADAKGSADQMVFDASLATASGQKLEDLAADVSVFRGQPSYGQQNVRFVASSGAPGGQITLNQGFKVWTPASQSGQQVVFDLVAPLVVPSPGSAVGVCQCEQQGTIGNVAVGAVTQFAGMDYLISVDNQSTAVLGQDPEADDSLRGRALAVGRTVAGSENAVEEAALSVNGCKFAQLVDPEDHSGITTLYAAAVDGTLDPTLQASVQSAVSAALPLTETCSVDPFAVVYAQLAANLAVPSTEDPAVTTAAVKAASIAFADTLGAGVTMQPMPWIVYVRSQVAAMQLVGADFYPTSAVPTVTTSELFRFLAAPAAPTLTQGTGGTIPTTSTVYVMVTMVTSSGPTLPSVEIPIVLSGSNDQVTVTVPPAPNSQVTSFNVYASTSSGVEKLQGSISVTTTSGGTLVLNSISTGGAAPPSTNTISEPTVTIVSA